MPFSRKTRPMNSTVGPLQASSSAAVEYTVDPKPLQGLSAANEFVKKKAIEFLKPNENVTPKKVR
jgi:hypothetical protein